MYFVKKSMIRHASLVLVLGALVSRTVRAQGGTLSGPDNRRYVSSIAGCMDALASDCQTLSYYHQIPSDNERCSVGVRNASTFSWPVGKPEVFYSVIAMCSISPTMWPSPFLVFAVRIMGCGQRRIHMGEVINHQEHSPA